MNKESITAELKNAVEILRLNKTVMAKVAGQKSATKYGIIILLVPFVVNLLIQLLTLPTGFSAIFSRFVIWPLAIPVASFILGILAISYAATTLFKAKGTHEGYFRIVSYASLISWVSMIPYLLGAISIDLGLMPLVSLISSIWLLVVSFQALEVNHKLNQQDAVISMVVGILAFLILQAILGNILVGRYYRFY